MHDTRTLLQYGSGHKQETKKFVRSIVTKINGCGDKFLHASSIILNFFPFFPEWCYSRESYGGSADDEGSLRCQKHMDAERDQERSEFVILIPRQINTKVNIIILYLRS